MAKDTRHTVAMFGGSFDPPHLGHKAIAIEALKRLDIDTLLVVPSYQNPLKPTSIATSEARLEMCQQTFDKIDNILISDYEIKQEIRYTFESVKYFKTIYDLKYLIIGADNLNSLHLWREFEWLNDNIIWVIASRDDIDTGASNILKEYLTLDIDMKISSSEIRLGSKQDMIDKNISQTIKTIY